AELSVPCPTLSEIETALAGGIGQGLHPAMKHIGAAVEHDPLDSRLLGALGDQLPDRGRSGAIGAGLDVTLDVAVERRGRGQRLPLGVVDDLRIDVPRRAEHRKPGPAAGRLPQLVALALPPPAEQFVWFVGHDYFFLPSLRRTVSVLYLIL